MRNSLFVSLVLSVALSGCDFVEKAERERERHDRDYRIAMDDYQAGRLEQAVKGLSKVCTADPSNASARFQLACLLQDAEKDYLGAFCAYREYLLQAPESDKAKLAKDRLAVCESEMSKFLAKKYGLDRADQVSEALKSVQTQLAESRKELERTRKELGEKARRVTALEGETARLKALIRAEGEASVESPAKDLGTLATDVPKGDDDEPAAPDLSGLAEAKRLLDEDDTEEGPESVSEAKELLSEMTEDPPMLIQPPQAKEKRDAEKTAQVAPKENVEKVVAPTTPGLEPIPANGIYIVREGDSLYKIANRFYGHTSAWRMIREANKATVSTDGRVRIGQRLVLPPAK